MDRLSDDELEAYAEYALMVADAPLLALVVELQHARTVLVHVAEIMPRAYARLERIEQQLVELGRVLG